jgi:hypothetical protein
MIGNAIAGFLGTGVAASTTAYESIQTTTVGSGGASSVTFSSIPSTYTHLQIRAIFKGSGAASVTMFGQVGNGSIDTGTNYSLHYLRGDGSSASASGAATQANFYAGASYNITSGFGAAIIDYLDYANTNKYKTIRALAGGDANGNGYVGLYSGNWRSTSAITDLKFTSNDGNFPQYSQFALYGIKG